MAKSRKVDIRGAGALVWRRNGRKIDVLVVHRPKYDDWSFPKGKLKDGETIRECCVREVKEETGVDIVLGVPAGWSHYETPEGNWKEVRYWMASVADSSQRYVKKRGRIKPAPKSEIDQVEWINIKDAKKILTSDDDRDMLGRLRDLVTDDKLETVPVILVRHTRAQKRSAWQGGDGSEDTRPLTQTGEDRAKMISPVLGAYGVTRLVSSPWKRCVDTVAPYASDVKIGIDDAPELTEHAHEKAPKKVAKFIKNVLRKEREPIAISLHRPTLPTVMETLADYTPHAIMKQVPKSEPWLKTGEMIIAHVAHRRDKAPTVVAFEKTRPLIER